MPDETTRDEVVAWLSPQEWDAECWPTTAYELAAAVREYATVGGVVDADLVARWLPVALDVWRSTEAPKSIEQIRMEAARDAAEMEDDRRYWRVVDSYRGIR